MIKRIGLLVVLVLFGFTGVGNAAPFTIEDTIRLMDQKGTIYASGAAIGPHNYETSRIVVDQVGDTIVFDLYSVYDKTGAFLVPGTQSVYTYLADLALDTTGDGHYDSAIVLSTGRGNALDVALYSGVTWRAAYDFMAGYSNILYGRQYDDGTGFKDSIVAISIGTKKDGASVAYVNDHWSVSVNLASLGITDPNSALGILWATATCGNDVIAGRVPVPEPSLSLLFGLALFGLGALGRRRLLKKE